MSEVEKAVGAERFGKIYKEWQYLACDGNAMGIFAGNSKIRLPKPGVISKAGLASHKWERRDVLGVTLWADRTIAPDCSGLWRKLAPLGSLAGDSVWTIKGNIFRFMAQIEEQVMAGGRDEEYYEQTVIDAEMERRRRRGIPTETIHAESYNIALIKVQRMRDELKREIADLGPDEKSPQYLRFLNCEEQLRVLQSVGQSL